MAAEVFTREVLTSKAEDFFGDVFPGAVIQVCDFALEDQPKIEGYGIWMADVVTADAEVCTASFVFKDTLYTQALEQLHAFEASEALPIGTHDEAIDSLFAGTFFDTWGKVLALIKSNQASS